MKLKFFFIIGFIFSTSLRANECLTQSELLNEGVLRRLINRPCVREWIQNENQRSKKFLAQSKIEEALKKRLSEFVPSNPSPGLHIGIGNVAIHGGSLILKEKGKETVLIDVSDLPKGTVVNEFLLSPDASKIAYALVSDGSDVSHWYFYDLQARKKISDSPLRMRFLGPTWDRKSTGLFYARWPSQQVEEAWVLDNRRRDIPIYYHRLGQDLDKLIFRDPDIRPSMLYLVEDVSDNTYLATRNWPGLAPASVFLGHKNHEGKISWSPVRSPGERPLVRQRYLGKSSSEAFFVSSECGNNFCIMGMRLQGQPKFRVVVGHDSKRIISNAALIGEFLYLQYFDDDFRVSVSIRDLNGSEIQSFSPRNYELPMRGTLTAFSGTASSEIIFFSYSAMDLAPVTIQYDIKNRKFTLLPNSSPDPVALLDVETTVSEYRSLDGTKIPIHVYQKKGRKGPAKFALLYYYGAIDNSVLSSFSPRFLMVLEMGGMVAVANVRGGGERGDRWFRIGALQKHKIIEDIASASRWLKKVYEITNNNVIAEGASWGGAHTYMTYNKFSEDFTAFISMVPVSNVPYAFQGLFGWLLFDDLLFRRSCNGGFSQWQQDMERVRSFSPIQNVWASDSKKPLLTIGASNDERTGPEQTYFFPMALGNKYGKDFPAYTIETEGGGHRSRSLIQELNFMAIQSGITEL